MASALLTISLQPNLRQRATRRRHPAAERVDGAGASVSAGMQSHRHHPRSVLLDQSRVSVSCFSETSSLNLHNSYLHENGLSGTIPDSVNRLSNLLTLLLVGNDLNGTVPSLSNLSLLTSL